MIAASFLAFCSGFLSLSLEILWIRLVSFSFHSLPQAFSFVLMLYLLGIAGGALLGKYLCKSQKDLWLVSGVTLMLSSITDLISPWIYADYVFANPDFPRHHWLIGGLLIILTSFLKSVVFPIAHHLGTPSSSARVGKDLSRVYVCNIIGAALGPILTGIVLLSLVTTQQAFIICALLTLLLACYCYWRDAGKLILSVSAVMLVTQLVLLVCVNGHALIAKTAITGYGNIINITENQYGIITIYAGPHRQHPENHIVAGNGAYDGSTNLDPVYNYNGINRVLVLSALVDRPARVLMIGLSIGSWLKMVETFPGIESIDVIEINPGYLNLIKNYPPQQQALLDSRVHLYIDDGRRWLKAHPYNRYDLIVLNTTYHWRAYTTNLLSHDFLQVIKRHMNPGAVVAYNSTSSLDALNTASSVFRHAYLYEKFVIAADFDWRSKLLANDAMARLSALQIDGRPLFPPHSQGVIAGYLHEPVITLQAAKLRSGVQRPLEIITDRNMITEFKYGRSI